VSCNPIYDAIETLFEARHRLPADAIRSLDSIKFCAEAALYHEPEGFTHDMAEYREHNTWTCEHEATEDDPVPWSPEAER
jgi:hypothetical protein